VLWDDGPVGERHVRKLRCENTLTETTDDLISWCI
jgi:hypothetical protein